MKRSNPIRTCIICKDKFLQTLLSRYRYTNGKLEFGSGIGRSFYICDTCLRKDDKILKKMLDKHTNGANLDLSNLKENCLNVKC